MSWVRMDDICEFLNGGAWSDKEYVASGLPVLKVSNCKNSGFQIEDINYLPITSKEKYAKNKLHKGDVIIATVGSHPNLVESAAGRSCVVNSLVDGFYLNQNAVCLRAKDSDVLDQGYLGYLCKGRRFQHFIQNKGRGAANQMRIAIGGIKEYEFDLPDIDIQRKIATILTAYDALIENNQKQIKLLEETAQRLYKEWFVDLRFPGYEETEIIDEIPMGWNETTIDSFIELQSGYAFKSSSFDDAGNYKIVTIKNVQDGAFDGDNVNKILEIPDKMPPHCKLQEGDSLLSLTGNVGRVCTVIGDNYLLNQRVAKIVSEYPCFSYCLFRSDKMFHDMNNLANGAAQQNLSPIRTGQLRIIKPDDETILKFEQMVKPILNKKNILNRDILIAAQARNRLLPKLMNGEIEV